MVALTIGQLAKKTKMNTTAIRYDECCGLLKAESRTISGYRQYSHDAIAKLRFIRNAQHLGFTLDEIADLMHMQTRVHKSRCSSVKEKAASRLRIIDKKIKSLKKMRNALNHLYEQCRGKGTLVACPIIDALNHTDFEETSDES